MVIWAISNQGHCENMGKKEVMYYEWYTSVSLSPGCRNLGVDSLSHECIKGAFFLLEEVPNIFPNINLQIYILQRCRCRCFTFLPIPGSLHYFQLSCTAPLWWVYGSFSLWVCFMFKCLNERDIVKLHNFECKAQWIFTSVNTHVTIPHIMITTTLTVLSWGILIISTTKDEFCLFLNIY